MGRSKPVSSPFRGSVGFVFNLGQSEFLGMKDPVLASAWSVSVCPYPTDSKWGMSHLTNCDNVYFQTLAMLLSNIPLTSRGPAQVMIFDVHALQERFYFTENVIPRLFYHIACFHLLHDRSL